MSEYCDTCRAFGWEDSESYLCLAYNIEECDGAWERRNVDRFDTEASVTGNDDDRWFCDYSSTIGCYGYSMTERCLSSGVTTGHALIPDVTIYKLYLETTEPTYEYLGCYHDDSSRDFCCGPQVYGYTPETCAQACTGYTYFALQDNGRCACDNDYSTPSSQYYEIDHSYCACDGEECNGGDWANAVYRNFEDAWEEYDSSLYKYYPYISRNFDGAESFCQSKGGHLATITSQSENDFIWYTVLGGSSESGDNGFWIGANDLGYEGLFTWVADGAQISYSNWGANEPTNTNDEDCVHLGLFYGFGDWNDESCSSSLNFVCEKDMVTDSCVTLYQYDTYGDGWNGNYFSVYSPTGYVVKTVTMDSGYSSTACLWLEAATCYNFGLSVLGSWESEASFHICGKAGDSETMVSFCTGLSGECLVTEAPTAAPTHAPTVPPTPETCPLWISEYDSFGDGWNGYSFSVYPVTGGSAIQTVTVHDGSSEETCLWVEDNACYAFEVSEIGFWPDEVSWSFCDVSGTTETPFAFCMDDGNCSATIELPCDYSTGSSCYHVAPNAMDYESAQSFCAHGGAHLVFIEDGSENEFVSSFSSSSFWLGLTYIQVEDTWVWGSGSFADYTNWYPGEHNDYSDGNCAQVTNDLGYLGGWYDVDCGIESTVVCEWSVDQCNGLLYVDQYDSYGDGWNGNYFGLYGQDEPTTLLQTVTLETDYDGQTCLKVTPGSCYQYRLSDIGSWTDEVSWTLCGQEGTIDTEVSFCIESDGSCSLGIPNFECNLEYGGDCYWVAEIHTTYSDAVALCEEEGASLASIADSTTDSLLGSLIDSESWIGIIQKNGTWEWHDGLENIYSNWAWGEPNSDHQNEDCAAMHVGGTWGAVFCEEQKPFICKKPSVAACQSLIYIEQYDSFGDGWNGNSFGIYSDQNSASPLQTGTMANGYVAASCLLVEPNSCYTMSLDSAGTWQNEISWTLCGVTGDYQTELNFCVDEDGNCQQECGSSIFVNQYDAYGDGWNGYAFSIYSEDDLSSPLQTVTLNDGYSGEACLDVQPNTCYYYAVSQFGGWAYEVAWSLCGRNGTVGTQMSFCVDGNGTCVDTSEDMCDSSIYIETFDSWADGWNGFNMGLYAIGDSSPQQLFTLEHGGSGADCLDVVENSCYVLGVANTGLYDSEVSWSVCNVTGDANSKVFFCVDGLGRCTAGYEALQYPSGDYSYSFDFVDDFSTATEYRSGYKCGSTSVQLYNSQATVDECETAARNEATCYGYFHFKSNNGACACCDENSQDSGSSSNLYSVYKYTVQDTVTDDDCVLAVTQFDSFGDGWNGHVFSLYPSDDVSQDSSTALQTATLDFGAVGETCLDVKENSCYFFGVSAVGRWSSEISWTLCGENGTAETEMYFCTDAAGQCLTETGHCEYLFQYDSSGDGWEGYYFSLFSLEDHRSTALQTVTLQSGYTGSACLNVQEDSCYGFLPTSIGKYGSEISWSLCGANGTAQSEVSFCIDASGSCTVIEDSTTSDAANSSDLCEVLEQFDTHGDGWNGHSFGLFLLDDTYSPLQLVTLEDGSSGSTCLSVQPNLCYTFGAADNGSFNSEISWELCGVKGGATDVLSFCVDEDGSCIVSSGNCEYLSLYDTWGDGWNGYAFSLYVTEGTTQNPQTATLNDGYAGVSCFNVESNTCYKLAPSQAGMYPNEVIWSMCGQNGGATDSLSFCMDASRVCVPSEDCSISMYQYDTDWKDGQIQIISLVDYTTVVQTVDVSTTGAETVCLDIDTDACYLATLASSSSSENDQALYQICGYDGSESSDVAFCIDRNGDCDYQRRALEFNERGLEETISIECVSGMPYIKMHDSGADGWNGYAFSLYNKTDASIVQTVSLTDGYYEEVCLDLSEDSCYYFEASSFGSWSSEVSWEICNTTGYYNTELSFCMGSNNTLNATEGDSTCSLMTNVVKNESTCSIYLDMWDSSGIGSGWQGGSFAVFDDRLDVVYNGTQWDDYSKCLNLEADNCYGVYVNAGSYPQYQAWSIPTCNISTKGACDVAWFCLDTDGVCTEYTERQCTDPALGEAEIPYLEGCDIIAEDYYNYYSWGTFGFNDTFTLTVEDTETCDEVLLTIHMDWTDYGSFQSDAYFELTNLDSGDTTDLWSQTMSVESGVLSLNEFSRIFIYCIEAGNYQLHIDDMYGDGWSNGYIHVSYVSTTQNEEIGSYTLTSDDYNGKDISFAVAVDAYNFYVTLEWPDDDSGTYPSEASFEVMDSEGEQFVDISGNPIEGVGVSGTITYSFSLDGSEALYLYLYDIYGDGWDSGTFTLSYSFNNLDSKFYLLSGTLEEGYATMIPLYIDSENAAVAKDVVFERSGVKHDWNITSLSVASEWHGCACGLCDSIEGFDMIEAESLAVKYLGLDSSTQDGPTYCNELAEEEHYSIVVVSYSFSELLNPVIVTFGKEPNTTWNVTDVTEGSLGAQCEASKTYSDCKREKGRYTCLLSEDEEGEQLFGSCSDSDFTMCSDPEQKIYGALTGTITAGTLTSSDLACSLIVAPNVPGPLSERSRIELSLEVLPLSQASIIMNIYQGYLPDAELLLNATFMATDNATSVDQISLLIPGTEFRINSLLNYETNGTFSSGGFASFVGSYRTIFNVSSSDMDVSNSTCEYTYCMNTSADAGFIVFDKLAWWEAPPVTPTMTISPTVFMTEDYSYNFDEDFTDFEELITSDTLSDESIWLGLTDTDLIYLIDMDSSPDSIWVNFMSFALMEGEALRIYDGASASDDVLVELTKGWFDADTGNSALFNMSSYAIIEADEYPVTMAMWLKAESEAVVIGDSVFSFSLASRRESDLLVPKVSWNDEVIWFGNTNITANNWTHVAVVLYPSQGFAEFLVNGAKVESCSGDPSILQHVQCPAVSLVSFDTTTAGGYLILGCQNCGPLESTVPEGESYEAFSVDQLQFFSQKLEASEVQGLYSNGSFECDFGDSRLFGCYDMDQEFTGYSGEDIIDGSMSQSDGLGYGMISKGGVSGASKLSSTTFASSGASLLLVLNRTMPCTFNGTDVLQCTNYVSSFIATYEARSCPDCVNGDCERGVCICDAGYGGELCDVYLVDDACKEDVAAVYGSEYKSAYGSLNLTVMHADYQRWLAPIYPVFAPSVELPQVQCEWLVSRDYSVVTIDWSPVQECLGGTLDFTIFDGIQHIGESADETLVSVTSFDETGDWFVEGSTGEAQVFLNTQSASWECSEDLESNNAVLLKYRVSKVYYVAPNEDFPTESKTRTGASESPFLSISAALDAVSEYDIILLYPGRYEGEDNLNLAIDFAVTIRGIAGSEYTIIDADDENVHFVISSLGSVVLDGIGFWNGYSDTTGASITVQLGELELVDCAFMYNYAKTGGTVSAIAPGSLSVTGTTFDSNEAGQYASAILADSAEVTIHQSTFVSNQAAEYGTIVSMKGSFSSVMSVTSCVFKDNEADYAAAVAVISQQLTVTGSIFENNEATTHTSGIYSTDKSVVSLAQVNFTDNVGRALTMESATSFTAANIVVEGTTSLSTEDPATSIYVSNSQGFEISGALFSLNDGNAIYFDQTTDVILASSLFSGCPTSCLYVYQTDVSISGSTFSNNAADRGAAIYLVENDVKATVSECTFEANEATMEGGAIYNWQTPMELLDSTFFSNTAEDGGSIFVTDTESLPVDLSGNDFASDTASGSGGSVYMFNALNVTATSNRFTDCSADEAGGWYLDECIATIDDLVMTGCSSSGSGGSLTATSDSFLYASNAAISFSESGTGGAIAIKSQSLFYLEGGSFIHNIAENGGAISVQEESDVRIRGGVVFSHNRATADGGALYLVRLTPLFPFLEGVSFYNNTATALGGSVYIALCDSMQIINMQTYSSEAEAGGDISSLASELTINSSYFVKGVTAQGGIYVLHSEFKMYDTFLGQGSAEENGGLIYAFASEMVIEECMVQNGSAGAAGGGLFLFDSSAEFHNTNFTGNQAVTTGGALYVTGTEEVIISHCMFSGNYGGRGGGVHFQESTSLNVLESTFVSNKALYEAAAILCEENNYVNITDSYFDTNLIVGTPSSSIYGGGAVKLDITDEAFISDSTFINNGGEDVVNATYYVDGGAIYISYSLTYISNCLFMKNRAEDGGAIYLGPETSSSSRRLEGQSHRTHTAGFSRLGLKERLFHGRHVDHASRKDSRGLFSSTVRKMTGTSSIYLSGSTFAENAASSGGGAMSYEENEPDALHDQTFANNTALFGSSFSSPPSYIVANREAGIEESGYTTSTIYVELRDVYDNIVGSYNEGEVFVTGDDSDIFVSVQTSATFRMGIATFDELVVEKVPGSSANISFSTSVVSGTSTIQLDFRPCISGEVLATGTGTCIYCSYGTFSIDPSDTYCHTCPTGAICYGGNQIKTLATYWRFENSTGVCDSPPHDDCALHACYEPTACEGDIYISDAVQFDPADTTRLIMPYGVNPKSIMNEKCFDQATNYSSCVFDLSGNFVTLSPENPIIEDTDTPLLSLSSESFAAVESLSTDRTASYTLHLVQEEQCNYKYQGNMCAKCSPGHGKGAGYICDPCPSTMLLTYIAVVAGCICVVVLGGIMIKLQMNKENSENEKISIMLKIFTSYLQLVSLFSAIDMSWPDEVQELFASQEMVSQVGDRLILIECIFNAADQSVSDTSIFYKKLAFFMSAPITAVVLCGTFWMSAYAFKAVKFRLRKWDFDSDEELRDIAEDGLIDADEVEGTLKHFNEVADPMRVGKIIEALHLETHPARVEHFQAAYLIAYRDILCENWILSVVVLLFMLHPNVSMYTFLVFTCTQLETGRFFLQEDLDTECYTPKHNLWRFACGIPFMGLYTFGIPGFAFFVLHKHRDNLKNKHVKLKYGFLYDGYEQPYYFWELWVMMRKVLVIMVTVFVANFGTLTEALGGLCVANFALVAHLRCQPYEDDSLDQLESYSLYATVTTLICGLFFVSGELGNPTTVFFMVVVLLVNISFVAIFSVLAFKEYRKKATTIALKAHDKIQLYRKDMKNMKNKTQSERQITQQKRKKVEKLEELYDGRMELQHEQVMNKIQIEEAKKKMGEKKEENAQLEHELHKLNKELETLLKDEAQGQLSSPKEQQERKRQSIVWKNHDDFLGQMNKAVLSDDLDPDTVDRNQYGEAIFRLYEQQSSAALSPALSDVEEGSDDGEKKSEESSEDQPQPAKMSSKLKTFFTKK